MRITLIALLPLLIMTACGGGGGGAVPSRPSMPATGPTQPSMTEGDARQVIAENLLGVEWSGSWKRHGDGREFPAELRVDSIPDHSLYDVGEGSWCFGRMGPLGWLHLPSGMKVRDTGTLEVELVISEEYGLRGEVIGDSFIGTVHELYVYWDTFFLAFNFVFRQEVGTFRLSYQS